MAERGVEDSSGRTSLASRSIMSRPNEVPEGYFERRDTLNSPSRGELAISITPQSDDRLAGPVPRRDDRDMPVFSPHISKDDVISVGVEKQESRMDEPPPPLQVAFSSEGADPAGRRSKDLSSKSNVEVRLDQVPALDDEESPSLICKMCDRFETGCGKLPRWFKIVVTAVLAIALWLMPGLDWVLQLTNPPVVPFDPILKNITTTTTTTATTTTTTAFTCNSTEGFLVYNETNDTFSCIEQCPAGTSPVILKSNATGNQTLRECWAGSVSNPLDLGLPFMESSKPLSGASNEPVVNKLEFTFNVPVEVADPDIHVTLTPLFSSHPAIRIPVTEASISNRSVTVTPPLLERDTTYEVSVPPGAWQSLDEQPMPSMEITDFFFTTVKAAKVAKVEMNITLEGLDFYKLMESPETAKNIREKMALQSALSAGVPVEMVRVTLAPGSVIAKTTILSDNAEAAKAHLDRMQNASEQSAMMARIGEELAEVDLSDIILPGRRLQIGVKVADSVEENDDGFPRLQRWSPGLDVEVFALNERIEASFNEAIQIGNASVVLFQEGTSNGLQLEIGAVAGSTMTVMLPALRLVPGSLYSLVLEPGCVMSLAGFGFEGIVRDFYVEGPQQSTQICGLAEACRIPLQGLSQGALSQGLPFESQVAVVQQGWCNKAGFSHPGGKGPFPDYWASVDLSNKNHSNKNQNNDNQSNDNQSNDNLTIYDIGTSLLAQPGIYDLCWRASKHFSYAVLFGTLSLTGPRETSTKCMLGSACPLRVSGLEVGNGSIAVHSSTATPGPGDCKSKALLSVALAQAPAEVIDVPLGAELVRLKAGKTYTLCWSPLAAYASPNIFLGGLEVMGPLAITSSKGSKLVQAAYAGFELHVTGYGFRSGGVVQLVAGKIQNCSSDSVILGCSYY
eukprot:TRINITY_DN8911_c0_g1_i3.p1 TRINITY_DN8911_c0_g1~~TRINITY_DN8911_c0_g1_i3.p1  ORF type:complete len:953 (-),score=158.15 TRINITY_DN8911_c0_g1_i3:51-2768(-)